MGDTITLAWDYTYENRLHAILSTKYQSVCSEHYHCYSFVTSSAFKMWNALSECIPIYKSHKILTMYNLSNRSCKDALHFCKSGKLKHKKDRQLSHVGKILPSMFIVVVLMVISMCNKLAGNQEVV